MKLMDDQAGAAAVGPLLLQKVVGRGEVTILRHVEDG
jgi:hypothetical protein